MVGDNFSMNRNVSASPTKILKSLLDEMPNSYVANGAGMCQNPNV